MTAEQHLARAVQAQQQGRRADVISEAEAALRLKSDHPIAHNMLGMEALARNDNRAALLHFRAATTGRSHGGGAVAESREGEPSRRRR